LIHKIYSWRKNKLDRIIKEFDFAGRRAVVVTDYLYVLTNVWVPSESTHVYVSKDVVVSKNELYNVFISVFNPTEQNVVFLPLYDMELEEAVHVASLYEQNDAIKTFLTKHWNDEYLFYENDGRVDALGFNIFLEGFEPFTFFG
jgi:hypothetical protein